jgi:hypothetical protein
MSKTVSMTAAVFAAFLVGAASVAAEVSASADQRKPGVPVGHPSNPETWYVAAELLSEQSNPTLLPEAVRTLALRALAAAEQALTLNPVYYDALILKAALLRQRATSEKDPAVQIKLIVEAEACSRKAAEIAKLQERESRSQPLD